MTRPVNRSTSHLAVPVTNSCRQRRRGGCCGTDVAGNPTMDSPLVVGSNCDSERKILL